MCMMKIDKSSKKSAGTLILPYFSIARPDHWFKNVFILPGLLVPFGLNSALAIPPFYVFITGVISLCLIASSNYVINEVLDAPHDRHHPLKKNRPVPSGQIILGIAYAEWLLLMMTGLAVSLLVSNTFFYTMLTLWIMGCVYNIEPVRAKDKPFVDVITESVNNPLRLLAGWFIVSPDTIPPLSLIISYWAIGCFFMAIKRFSEFRTFESDQNASLYRRSFGYYTESMLLISIMYYAAMAMLFFGAFIGRFRLELFLSFPLVALFMAVYLALGLQKNSVVQTPEKLYQNKHLVITLLVCVTVMIILILVDMPFLYKLFTPSILKI
jgi:decaprenyl-phosphate phosphoribosyltransferase